MEQPFSIGQKVVCINDEPGWISGRKALENGKIYTVLGLIQICPDKCDIDVGVGTAWDCSRFAPLKYNDATSEILEKFKHTSETPDKIIVPQTETV